MGRHDGRKHDEHRPVSIDVGFHRNAEGSVMYRAGGTVVLCTASVDASVPSWMQGTGRGWLTAEYQMHPRANPARRESRDGRGRAPSGRTQEIQRLIGRSLRAAIRLERLGERSIVVDCDVLEADGGTRTASITGGFVALAIALAKVKADHGLPTGVIRDQVAAISVGHVDQEIVLDLDYPEDSAARVDLNLVATANQGIVEVQGTAEGAAIPRSQLDEMVDLGLAGISSLAALQKAALSRAEVSLDSLYESDHG